jgi:hypothetical protein
VCAPIADQVFRALVSNLQRENKMKIVRTNNNAVIRLGLSKIVVVFGLAAILSGHATPAEHRLGWIIAAEAPPRYDELWPGLWL